MATNTSYDRLYENMKNRFTVISENEEYNLGSYMLMKAGKKKEETNLPVAQRSTATKGERAVAMLVSYVSDKLTVKNPPAKDKTLRSFPFRASASAFLSAAVTCAFVLSFALIGAKIITTSMPISDLASSEYTETLEEYQEVEAE